MTDQELIKALRWCGDGLHGCCIGCPSENTCGAPDGGAKTVLDAADRLEALLPEVTELKKNVAMLLAEKSEMGQHIRKLFCDKSNLDREVGRLEVERDHFRDLTKKMWCEKGYAQWVSVDEPPKEYGKYIVYDNWDEKVTVLRFVGSRANGEQLWIDEDGFYHYHLTHWQPLPEPPSTEVSHTGQKG